MHFSFKTNVRSELFCEGIARLMVILYEMSSDEAVASINASWHGLDLTDACHIIYHEDERYWADILANPNPYRDAITPEQTAWQERHDNARNRFAQLEWLHPNFRLTPPKDWPSLNS